MRSGGRRKGGGGGLSSLFRRRTERGHGSLVDEDPSGDVTHAWKATWFTAPTWCSHCNNFIWVSVSKQGYQCSRTGCGFAVHNKCFGYAEHLTCSQSPSARTTKRADQIQVTVISLSLMNEATLSSVAQQSFIVQLSFNGQTHVTSTKSFISSSSSSSSSSSTASFYETFSFYYNKKAEEEEKEEISFQLLAALPKRKEQLTLLGASQRIGVEELLMNDAQCIALGDEFELRLRVVLPSYNDILNVSEQPSSCSSSSSSSSSVPLSDSQLARKLALEWNGSDATTTDEATRAPPSPQPQSSSSSSTLSDSDFARKLAEEEEKGSGSSSSHRNALSDSQLALQLEKELNDMTLAALLQEEENNARNTSSSSSSSTPSTTAYSASSSTPSLSITCPYTSCQNQTIPPSQFIQHVTSQHASDGFHQYECPLCFLATGTHYTVSSNTNLLSHVQNQHSPDEGFGNTDVDSLSYEELLRLEEQIGTVAGGVEQNIISQLPLHTFQQQNIRTSSEPSPECSVCLCDYEVGEELRTLPCLHSYHKACIDMWLEKHRSCPICKYDIRL